MPVRSNICAKRTRSSPRLQPTDMNVRGCGATAAIARYISSALGHELWLSIAERALDTSQDEVHAVLDWRLAGAEVLGAAATASAKNAGAATLGMLFLVSVAAPYLAPPPRVSRLCLWRARGARSTEALFCREQLQGPRAMASRHRRPNAKGRGGGSHGVGELPNDDEERSPDRNASDIGMGSSPRCWPTGDDALECNEFLDLAKQLTELSRAEMASQEALAKKIVDLEEEISAARKELADVRVSNERLAQQLKTVTAGIPG